MSLSVAIIARDEERHLAGALESVRGLAGEVVVLLDSRTRDRSVDVAHSYGARVFVEPWRGFPAQRNHALDLCTGDWVLFLDADERLTDELRDEILQIVGCRLQISGEQSAIAGYWIPRHNQFFGRALRGGGWYPDHQLR